MRLRKEIRPNYVGRGDHRRVSRLRVGLLTALALCVYRSIGDATVATDEPGQKIVYVTRGGGLWCRGKAGGRVVKFASKGDFAVTRSNGGFIYAWAMVARRNGNFSRLDLAICNSRGVIQRSFEASSFPLRVATSVSSMKKLGRNHILLKMEIGPWNGLGVLWSLKTGKPRFFIGWGFAYNSALGKIAYFHDIPIPPPRGLVPGTAVRVGNRDLWSLAVGTALRVHWQRDRAGSGYNLVVETSPAPGWRRTVDLIYPMPVKFNHDYVRFGKLRRAKTLRLPPR